MALGQRRPTGAAPTEPRPKGTVSGQGFAGAVHHEYDLRHTHYFTLLRRPGGMSKVPSGLLEPRSQFFDFNRHVFVNCASR